MSNTLNGHYTSMKIQPIDFIVQNDLSFIEGNIVKYVARHKQKGGINDLLKAKHYLDMLMQTYIKDEQHDEHKVM
jgi:hypothetical protein